MNKQEQAKMMTFMDLAKSNAIHYELAKLDTLCAQEKVTIGYLYQLGYLVEPNVDNGYVGRLCIKTQ